MKTFLLLVISLSLYAAPLQRLKHVAQAAVCSTQAADAASSYRDSQITGLHETNGVYTPDGRFSISRMVAIKSAVCAGFVFGSQLTHSRIATIGWTVAGATISTVTGYAAIQNMKLK
jgi:hypothetical protein